VLKVDNSLKTVDISRITVDKLAKMGDTHGLVKFSNG
jgi:hypothetical protein